MQYDQIARLLRSSRLANGVTQSALAERAGVSQRLWAEVERGERPNVSLTTALRMLRAAGIGIHVADSRQSRSRGGATGLAARAAARRATWTGRQTTLAGADAPPTAPRGRRARIAAVTRLSNQAFAVARANPVTTGRHGR